MLNSIRIRPLDTLTVPRIYALIHGIRTSTGWETGRARSLIHACIAMLVVGLGLGLENTTCLAQDRMYLTLNNGLSVGPARRADIDSVKLDGSINNRSNVSPNVIVEADDDLRKIYFNKYQITDGNQERWTPAKPQIKITLPNKERVAEGNPYGVIAAFHETPQSFDFSDLGRRFYRFGNDKVAIQGITEISPNFVRVEGLKGNEGAYQWDMRLALDSIRPATLRRILVRNADPNKARSYLDIVELYESAKRYTEAREMLVFAMQKFPELENNRSSLKRFDQLAADQLFVVADTAKKSTGQHKLAKQILDSFDYDLLSLETKLKVERQKELMATEQMELDELIAWIEEDIAQLKEEETRTEFLLVLAEIKKFLSPDLSTRFADYRRLRQNTKPEARAALAIGGWVFGAGVADDNVSLISSSVKARDIIQKYLGAPVANDQLLEDLSKLEAGTPRYVSRIVANMAPPLPTPDESLFPIKRVTDPSKPDELQETTVPGRYLLEIPLRGKLQGQTAYYLVQLPPEYNPYRRYPCVVTMHGTISTAEEQLNWWCGAFDPSTQRCWGHAPRNGYIIISPYWGRPAFPIYNFTEDEHAFVLSTLFDAKRRFSIDTDRVYLSGHGSGGTGAWDIALAHPDLWAGCVVICGTVDKYIQHYAANTRYVPFYFVDGALTGMETKDGMQPHRDINGMVWNNLLKDRGMDVMVSEYIGRGLDHFAEELPRIFEWMNAPNHVRNFALDRFEVRTSRPGDSYFWWFETDSLYSTKMLHPLYYPGKSDYYKIESRISKETNTIDLISVPADQFTVGISPDMVDTSQPISIRYKGDIAKRIEPNFDSRTLLKDVRQRADRQHPFWALVRLPR